VTNTHSCLLISEPSLLQSEHVKRTHDYEPFIQNFVLCLHNEGLLDALLYPGEPTGGRQRKVAMIGKDDTK